MPGNWRSGGHNAVPTALKLIRGTRVRGRQREPKYDNAPPDCPADVQADEVAHRHWTRLAERLGQSGVLTVAHGDALAALSHALADYQRVREQLHRMNYQQLVVDEVRDKTGTVVIRRRIKENPLIRRSERLSHLVSRLLGEFGLTPVTQTKVHAHPTGPVDPFEAFLGRAR